MFPWAEKINIDNRFWEKTTCRSTILPHHAVTLASVLQREAIPLSTCTHTPPVLDWIYPAWRPPRHSTRGAINSADRSHCRARSCRQRSQDRLQEDGLGVWREDCRVLDRGGRYCENGRRKGSVRVSMGMGMGMGMGMRMRMRMRMKRWRRENHIAYLQNGSKNIPENIFRNGRLRTNKALSHYSDNTHVRFGLDRIE